MKTKVISLKKEAEYFDRSVSKALNNKKIRKVYESEGDTDMGKKIGKPAKIKINTKLFEQDLKRNLQNPEFKAAFDRERASSNHDV